MTRTKARTHTHVTQTSLFLSCSCSLHQLHFFTNRKSLHLNIVSETQDNRILPRLEPFLFELTAEFGGSISAEHGLGRMKAGDIGYSKNASSVAVMRALKSTFDPLGILNPYKFLPSTNQEKKTLPTNDTKAPREIEFEDKHRSKWDIWAAAR